jgi:hypothetical protein
MFNTIIEVFEMSYEESVSYFKRLENLEKNRRTNGLGPAILFFWCKDPNSVTDGKVKSSENTKPCSMRCQFCEKYNNNTAHCRTITTFKHQKKDRSEAKSGPGKTSLAFISFLKKSMHSKDN